MGIVMASNVFFHKRLWEKIVGYASVFLKDLQIVIEIFYQLFCYNLNIMLK